MITDTHSHLYFPTFDNDRDEVVKQCQEAGVERLVQIGCDEISVLAILQMIQQDDAYKAVIGLHPCSVDDFANSDDGYRTTLVADFEPQIADHQAFLVWMDQLCEEKGSDIIGLGETGFDFYHQDTPELRTKQEESLRGHIDLGVKYDLPLVIHLRSAKDYFVDFWRKLETPKRSIPGVIHAFCDGPTEAKIFTEEFNFFLGIGGMATYPKNEAIREAIRETPIEFLVLETDSPFLVPQKQRNKKIKRNSPEFLPPVLSLIAELKGISEEECEKQLEENVGRLFPGVREA